MNTTDRERARRLIERVGLALNACHNTVTTDDPAVEPGETSWRIDNSKEIVELDELAEIIGVRPPGAPAKRLNYTPEKLPVIRTGSR